MRLATFVHHCRHFPLSFSPEWRVWPSYEICSMTVCVISMTFRSDPGFSRGTSHFGCFLNYSIATHTKSMTRSGADTEISLGKNIKIVKRNWLLKLHYAKTVVIVNWQLNKIENTVSREKPRKELTFTETTTTVCRAF